MKSDEIHHRDQEDHGTPYKNLAFLRILGKMGSLPSPAGSQWKLRITGMLPCVPAENDKAGIGKLKELKGLKEIK